MRTSSVFRRSLFGLAVLAGLLLGACVPQTAPPEMPPPAGQPSPPGPPADSVRAALDAARARWDAAGIVDYAFVYEEVCFCLPEDRGPFAITVRDGAVASATYQGEPANARRTYPTVDSLFATVEDALDRGAESVRVTFDPVLGYPAEASIDYEAMVADEELGFRVSDLTR